MIATIIVIITTTINTLLGLFVLKKTKDRLLGRLFFLLTLSFSIWAVTNYYSIIYLMSPSALFWIRLVMSCAILQLFIFRLLVLHLSDRTKNFRQQGYLAATIICLIITNTSFMFSRLSIDTTTGSRYPVTNYGIIIFILFTAFTLLDSFLRLIYGYRASRGIKRKQILIFSAGVLAMFLLFIWYNLINTTIFHNDYYIVYSPIFTLPFIIGTGHSILEFQLFGIRLTNNKLSIYVALLATMFTTYSAASLIFSDANTANRFISFIIFGSIGTYLIVKIYREDLMVINRHNKLSHDYSLLQQRHKSNVAYIADVAHQLKSPLAIIQARLDLIQNQTSIEEDDLQEMNQILNNTASTVRNLINISKIDHQKTKLHLHQLDLNQFLLRLMQDAERIIQPRKLKYTTTHNASCWVNADSSRLQEAILNLVDNAAKFSPVQSTILISLTGQANKILLTVTDQGQGMDKETKTHLFERHYQSEEGQQHTGSAGLGLAITKWIIEEHGGTIAVESKLDHGSTFTITLPTLVAGFATSNHEGGVKKRVVKA